MPLYRPSELRAFLKHLQTDPKKALSQNFLIDGNIIRKIITLAVVSEEDTIVEIGPGPGALTEALLATGARVLAVEKDRVLADALGRLQTPDKRLSVIEGDVLKCDLEEVVSGIGHVKVVANLPYHLTTPILERLLPRQDLFQSLTVMVQDEVARRLTAIPGTKDYSAFSVYLQYHSFPKYGFKVGGQCFYPVPKVDSAVVHLCLHETPPVSDEVAFFKMTRQAFGQRRKMLRSSLREQYHPDQVMAALSAMGLDPQARPETLSLVEFIQLFERLSGSSR